MAARVFIINCFDPTLRITKSCCRVVLDDRFEVNNYPDCKIIGFSISALSWEEGKWRKLRKGNLNTRFSCSHQGLAVDISRCWAEHQCQLEDLFHAIEQEKKEAAMSVA